MSSLAMMKTIESIAARVKGLNEIRGGRDGSDAADATDAADAAG